MVSIVGEENGSGAGKKTQRTVEEKFGRMHNSIANCRLV